MSDWQRHETEADLEATREGLETAMKRIAALEADLAAARAALEAVEWIYDGLWHRCPWCKGYKVREGHAPNCKRQSALGLENNPKKAK